MKILDRLPYWTEATTVPVPGGTVRVKPYQIVVQVSVGLRAFPGWDPRTPSFPAVLDTGHNHNFSIRRSHLVRWAGLQPEALRRIGTMKERQQRIPMHAAKLWLHRNLPGERTVKDGEVHALNIEGGIAIYPDDTGPRLPLVGLRALTENDLHLSLNGRQRRIWLGTVDWRVRFMQWLFE